MRISDWSSDVCSSDLNDRHGHWIVQRLGLQELLPGLEGLHRQGLALLALRRHVSAPETVLARVTGDRPAPIALHRPGRPGCAGAWRRFAGPQWRLRRAHLQRGLERSEEPTSELQSLMRTS